MRVNFLFEIYMLYYIKKTYQDPKCEGSAHNVPTGYRFGTQIYHDINAAHRAAATNNMYYSICSCRCEVVDHDRDPVKN